jgi:hypothetical protein
MRKDGRNRTGAVVLLVVAVVIEVKLISINESISSYLC